MTQRDTTCLLCGATDPLHVRVRLVDWRDPANGEHFAAFPRCDRTEDCRARVEAQGERWELRSSEYELPTRGRGNVGDILEVMRRG